MLDREVAGDHEDVRISNLGHPLLLATCGLGHPVRAGDKPDSWVGRQVVTRIGVKLHRRIPSFLEVEPISPPAPPAILLNPKKQSGNPIDNPNHIYKVEKIDGLWLHLSHGHRPVGWARVSDIVSIEHIIEVFSDEIRANPTDGLPWAKRALGWHEKEDNGRAIADLTRAIELQPDLASAYALRGRFRDEVGDYDGALADTSLSLDIEPDQPEVLVDRASVWSQKGNHLQAIEDSTKAIKLDPLDGFAYFVRGGSRVEMGDADGAIADLSIGIELHPTSLTGYISRGDVWARKQEHDRAIADYDRAVNVAKTPADLAVAYIARGRERQELEELHGAIADFDVAIANSSIDGVSDAIIAYSFYNRGLVLEEQGNLSDALADFTVAIRRSPTYYLAHQHRGHVLMNLGRFEKAMIDFEEAIRLAPSVSHSHGYLAELRATCPIEKFRNGRKALDSATRACELTMYQDPYWVDVLAAAHAEAGNFKSAVYWQEKAIKACEDEEFRAEARSRLML